MVSNYVLLRPFWLSSISDFWQEVYTTWSVPISPAVVIVPRFTVSGREWLLPTAARFLPAAVPRAARFCLLEHDRWRLNPAGWSLRAKRESKQGEICALLPFYVGPYICASPIRTCRFFCHTCAQNEPWNTQSIPAVILLHLCQNLSTIANCP